MKMPLFKSPGDRGETASGRSGNSEPLATSQSQRNTRHEHVVVYSLLLALLVLGTFAPTLRNGFINFDDQLYVTDNSQVQRGINLDNFAWAFQSVSGGNWHPLTWLSHMLDCQLYGLSPWGHHLTSVLLHAASAILLFHALTGATQAAGRSFFVAALFGLHPLRVESVAWIAERKDVLCTFFWMLTMYCYIRYAKESARSIARSRAFYSAMLASFALGLLAKPMLVTLPFALLFLDFWPLKRFGASPETRMATTGRAEAAPDEPNLSRLILEKLPLLILSGVASFVAWSAQRAGGYVVGLPDFALSARIENAVVGYARYIGKILWPQDLAIFYPLPEQWSATLVIFALGLLAVISICGFAWRRRFPYLLTGWVWFIVTLLPVIGLVRLGDQSIADRYTYIPSVGLFIAIVWGANHFLAQRRVGATLPIAGSFVLICFSGLSIHQLAFWQNSEKLFRHAFEVSGSSYSINKCLGDALVSNGKLAEGIRFLEMNLKIDPNDFDTYTDLGIAYGKLGNAADAIIHLETAVKLRPDSPAAHLNLGAAYCQSGRTEAGISEFRQALKLDPNDAQAHFNLGLALADTGRRDEAASEFERALKLQPDYPEAEQQLRDLKKPR